MNTVRNLRITMIGIVFALSVGASSARADPVGLELLLLVDVSGSVDANEFNLQRQGYVNAFNNPNIINAILSNSTGSIAVSLVYWSGGNQQRQVVGWTLINSASSAQAFANAINSADRPFSGSTSISGAINFGTPLFMNNGYEGERLVMDVSGDGSNNSNPSGVTLADARDNAISQGIIINGLAITTDEANLLSYYQNNVIGGIGSFAIQSNDFNSFGAAIERKLLIEIPPDPVPEPSTMLLLGTGLAGIVVKARGRRKAHNRES